MCLVCGDNPVEPIERVEIVGDTVKISFENQPFPGTVDFTMYEADLFIRAHGSQPRSQTGRMPVFSVDTRFSAALN
jgi:hypothetical protein